MHTTSIYSLVSKNKNIWSTLNEQNNTQKKECFNHFCEQGIDEKLE